MVNTINILGTGSYVPEAKITNEELTQFLGDYPRAWTPKKILEKTGIRERRHLFPLGKRESGSTETPDTDMAYEAAIKAVAASVIPAGEIGGLIYVTCTPDYIHFSRSACDLHQRLGLSEHAFPHQIDSGCGGVMAGVGLATRIINSGCGSILIVAANTPSAFIERERYTQVFKGKDYTAALSPIIFGDGAGAMLLANNSMIDGHKILASYYGANTTNPLMYYRGGGASKSTWSYNVTDHIYEIDAIAVAEHFAPVTIKALKALQTIHKFELMDVTRFYFHQANLRLLEGLIAGLGIPIEKVAINVNKYGNTSAPSTLLLLDEDVRNGNVNKGDLLLFCAMGAGAHYGAFLVQW